MANFYTPHKRKKHKMTRDYQTSAVIDAEFLPPEAQQNFANKLESAVYAASANYSAVTQYFVKLEDSIITVGLQLEKVEPAKVENIVAALLQESLESLTRSMGWTSPVEIEESELYPV